jgi:hypothetical protein
MDVEMQKNYRAELRNAKPTRASYCLFDGVVLVLCFTVLAQQFITQSAVLTAPTGDPLGEEQAPSEANNHPARYEILFISPMIRHLPTTTQFPRPHVRYRPTVAN